MDDKKQNLVSYHSKLVGVTFEGRQEVISLLEGGEELRFRREPDNEHDSNAVAVDVLMGEQGNADNMDITTYWAPIGYIARTKNSELAELLTDGKYATIKISDITGGGDKSFGVNVYIEHERKRKTERSPNAVPVVDYFGNKAYYDPVLHEYTNSLGEVYLSGSAYAADEPFDSDLWASYFVEKYGLKDGDKQRIIDMWETNGNASRSFGTALHAAIELYGEYHELADVIDVDPKTGKRKMIDAKTEKNSALSKLPYLNKAAREFFTPERAAEKARYEVLIIDHKNKRAGRIDRLVVDEFGRFTVCDMKTNNKLSAKEKKGYTKQLSFYADLIIANGGTLSDNPIVIHHWTEETWEDIPLKKINTLE